MKHSRRDFLKLGGGALAGALLAACAGAPDPTPTQPLALPTDLPEAVVTQPPPALPTTPGARDQSLIFMIAPTVADRLFTPFRSAVLALYNRLTFELAHPNDRFYVIADEATVQAVGDQLPPGRVVITAISDVRVRDFAPLPAGDGWVQFVYDPPYMTLRNALAIQTAFERWFSGYDQATEVALQLDGGNVARYGQRAVVTDRIYADNARRDAQEVRQLLRDGLQVTQLALIPADPTDPTGQAARLVCWLATDVLAVSAVPEPLASGADAGDIRRVLVEALPDVRLVDLPYAPPEGELNGFASAAGVYTSTLRTPNAIYVPQFGLPEDASALAVFQASADRPVIPVPIGTEATQGAGLHTLTWDASGDFAAQFLANLA